MALSSTRMTRKVLLGQQDRLQVAKNQLSAFHLAQYVEDPMCAQVNAARK